jgi:hypothetical protein
MAIDGVREQGMLSTISNEMVRIYNEQFGRGPTKTRTRWAGPDVLVVTLEQTFTPAQRSLRKMASTSACAICACSSNMPSCPRSASPGAAQRP